ncbi:hypothetical protein ACFLXO_03735 [Chloroflexota bacterium]
MNRIPFQLKILRQIIIAIALVLCSVPIHLNTATAQSLEDYFSVSYVIEISKTDIQESEVFYVTVEATATCHTRLPVSPSEANFTSRVIAEHQVSGAKVTLNSGYTVTMSPFPSQAGQTVQDTQVISLQFPAESQPGSYNIIVELIEAKVKVSIMWFDVKSYFPPFKEIGSVNYNIDSGSTSGNTSGNTSGGSSVGSVTPLPTSPALPPGTHDVSGYIRSDGIFAEEFQAKSTDGNCKLTIAKGTSGLTQEGNPLNQIAIVEEEEPPTLPEFFSIVGPSYDLGPDGARFDPAVTITFTYEESLIPAGVAEEKLAIATWNEEAGDWVMLTDSTVDPEVNTINATFGHFTTFSILAHTHPATFTVNGLSITPNQVNIGENTTISIIVTNSGDLAGSYEVVLTIDNVIISEREATVEGGNFEKVTFITNRDTAGTYAVDVNGLLGTFTVTESPPIPLPIPSPPISPSPSPSPSPTPATFNIESLSISPDNVAVGEEVSISFLIANSGDFPGSYEVALKIDDTVVEKKDITLEGGGHKKVTFINNQDTAGTHTVNVNGLSGTFTVTESAPEPLTSWWLIGGIFAGFIILVVIIILVIRRQIS